MSILKHISYLYCELMTSELVHPENSEVAIISNYKYYVVCPSQNDESLIYKYKTSQLNMIH